MRFLPEEWREIQKRAGRGECAHWVREVIRRELAEPRVVVEA